MSQEAIIDQLNKLNLISKQLDLPESQRTELLHQTADYANNFISTLHTIKGYQEKTVGDLSINNKPAALHDILNLYQKEVAESGINAASPKHLGYIPGGGVYTAALADFIAAVTNPFAGAYFAAPGAATI